jgi:glucose/arabinose dehydrogenase
MHRTIAAAACAFISVSGLAQAQVELATETIASGFTNPVFAAQAPGQPGLMWVVEQRSGNQGRVRILDLNTGTPDPSPVLSVTVATGNEQGLLGLAFHPDFQNNGKLYINYTQAGGTTRIVEYTASGPDKTTIDPASARPILSIPQPFANHNAGWIGFGPERRVPLHPNGRRRLRR